ncbi:tol-pal system-associated acyl-CoA thioesterase [Castellaniella sp. GW247-6E4]|uniref:tol-pal system-associated acyl-CoA thioesterase n=1 Tax=Castellaniella sp. GW247-6E4 TaxID=3140380 RepID=UPI0033160F64
MDPHAPNPPATLPIRVYYEDTDTGGVVYYANYLKFFERGRTEWLRALGMNQRVLAAQERVVFVVRRAAVTYHRPARLDDRVDIHTAVANVGASILLFAQEARRDDELLATADIQVCAVHSETFKPVRMTPSLRNLLEKARN